MKRIVLILLALGLCITVGAQTKRHEISVGGGLTAHPDKLFDEFFPKMNSDTPDLYDLYEPLYRNVRYSPLASIEYNYNILPWMKAGLSAGYFAMWGNKYYAYNDEEHGVKVVHSISLLPHVKFNAINRDHFKLYGGVGCGAAAMLSKEGTDFRFVYEIVPAGIEFGGELVYGMSEITITNLYFGVRVGVGFRF